MFTILTQGTYGCTIFLIVRQLHDGGNGRTDLLIITVLP